MTYWWVSQPTTYNMQFRTLNKIPTSLIPPASVDINFWTNPHQFGDKPEWNQFYTHSVSVISDSSCKKNVSGFIGDNVERPNPKKPNSKRQKTQNKWCVLIIDLTESICWRISTFHNCLSVCMSVCQFVVCKFYV